MAAGLLQTDEMVSVREIPWHKKGIIQQEYQTAQQMLEQVANWFVLQRSLLTEDGTAVSDYFANVRSDTGDILGIVGKDYTIVQNHEMFSFLDQIIGPGQACYDTAGTVWGGKRVWISAKTSEMQLPGVKDDIMQDYLLASMGHDGKNALRVLWTRTRVVCQNTLNAALARKTGFYARHTVNVHDQIRDAQELLGFARQKQQEMDEAYKLMTDIHPNKEEVDLVVRQLVPERLPTEETPQPKDTWTHARDTILDIYENSPTCNLPGMERTGWGLYNAATEYSDWYARPKLTNEQRFQRMSEGSAEFKEQAFNYVMSLA